MYFLFPRPERPEDDDDGLSVAPSNPASATTCRPALSRETIEVSMDAATVVSKISDDTEDTSEETLAPDLTDADMALLMAQEKKSARRKVYDQTGRKRPRGGKNLAHYEKWATQPKKYG